MANEKFPFGRNAKLYYNTNDTLVDSGNVATWLSDANTVEAGNVRNLALGLDNTNADTNTRDSTAGGFSSQTPVLKNGEITFDTTWDLSDGFLTQLLTAWSGSTQRGFAILNRDKDTLTTGDVLNGLVGNFFVGLTKDENVDDIQRGNFTITHADNGIWHTETGGP